MSDQWDNLLHLLCAPGEDFGKPGIRCHVVCSYREVTKFLITFISGPDSGVVGKAGGSYLTNDLVQVLKLAP